jgi:hypothetical protein
MNLRQSLHTSSIVSGSRDLFRNARLSLFEIIFLVAALLFAAFVAFFYLSKVQPLNSEVTRLKEREIELRASLERINNDEKKRADQATNAEKILESLARFESYLKPDERGMTQIINEIDVLGRTHKITVGDASYRVAEPEATTDENGNPLPQTASTERVNMYPKLGIDTTVIGDYPSLRRFLSDLERSKQFLIINSLSFQGEADRTRQPAAGGPQVQAGSAGAAPAIPVSLRIELDTYFQRALNTGQQ